MTHTDERPPIPDVEEPPWEPPEDPGPTSRARNGHPRPINGTPPQDFEAEQALLGAMLISAQAIDDVAGEIEPSDFYRPHHETIHQVITDLHDARQPVDMVTVAAELNRRGQMRQIGGHLYLHDLAAAVPTAANATYYAKLVRDKARARVFVATGTRIAQLGHAADPIDLDNYLGTALQALDDAVMRFGPKPGQHGPGSGLVDLSWVATNGQAPRQPAPVYVRRSDGTALFYAGQVNGIFGDPEHGKTWAAQLAAVQALNEGGTAAMIDVDHNGPDATSARMLLLGARVEHIADPDRFRYYEPHEGAELLNAITDVTTRAIDVVIIDSLGEIFPMLGVKTNDGDEITTAMRQVCTRPALAGSCVITIDHLPKNTEARSTGFAIGSIAKKRMIRGAYLRADAMEKPTPGGIGRITLRIEKDTMGELRRSSGGGYAGTLILDSTRDYGLEWSIRRSTMPKNDDGSNRYTTVMQSVATYIEDHPGCSKNEIETDVPGKGTTIRAALTTLVNEGFIRREPGPRRAFFHYSEIPYREAEDDHAQPTD